MPPSVPVSSVVAGSDEAVQEAAVPQPWETQEAAPARKATVKKAPPTAKATVEKDTRQGVVLYTKPRTADTAGADAGASLPAGEPAGAVAAGA
ncbi:hypothetical protein [Streptomyces cinereoruber]|uniref:hypothetical protein n=1 Tax=Streptomyces cinereoruber TaxID=67260 RepID=UPI00362CFB50